MKPQSEAKCSRVANVKTSKCKVVKSLKPLVNFRFYLDIEKHHVSLKIESKIKELGGSIEFLLTKDITHFITDKIIDNKDTFLNSQAPASPQTSLSNYSEIGSNASNSNDSKGGGKIKSRADAMLQRARKVTTESERQSSINRSPSQVARRWGTPIWHTEYALKYFEKVYNAIKEHYKGDFPPKSKEKPGNAKVLKGHFIKVESFQKQFRPYYHLLKGKWPTINLQSDENLGAFIYANEQSSKINAKSVKAPITRNLPESKKSHQSNMTRKNRSTKHIRVQPSSRLSSEKQCGYCEICHVEYDVLTTHLKTDEHVNFVKNDRNFLELDSLIKSSANVKFLSINKSIFNGSDCEIFPKRSRRAAAVNNRLIHKNSQSDIAPVKSDLDVGKRSLSDGGFSRYTRQSFSRQSINLPPPTLTRCDEIAKKQQIMGAVVRARRESIKKINYAEPGEDEENSDDGLFMDVQRKQMKPPKIASIKVKVEESPDPKPKRPLSTVMYKVVETKTDPMSERKEPLTEKNFEQPAPLIVKFRKVRQSELSILNGEAVNFMFPPKMSSDVLTDVDRHTTSEPRTPLSNEYISSPKRKSSVLSQNADDNHGTANGKRKKLNNTSIVTTPIEMPVDVVVSDNTGGQKKVRRYRKRRFPGAPIQPYGRRRIKIKPVLSVDETEIDLASCPTEDGMGEKDDIYKLDYMLKNELSKYKFAFERVPHSEPWYDVFKRQDESKECVFEYYGNTVYRKLPYEMGPLPPLPANCDCHKSNSESDTPSTSTSLEEPKPNESVETITQPVEEDINPEIVKRSKSPLKNLKKIVNRTAALINMEMPRKSPREHPSTLAILSCLINRREDKRKVEKPKAEPTRNNEDDVQKSPYEAVESKMISEIATPTTPKREVNNASAKDETNMQISPQIGESVKRLRRGEKLLESRKCKVEPNLAAASPSKRAVGRPRKNFGGMILPRKPLMKKGNDKVNEACKREEKYVDVNRLKKQIDLYLSQPPIELDLREDEGIMPVGNKDLAIDDFQHDLELGNLVFDGTATNDAMNVFNTNTTKSVTNKMRFYKLFSMNKKVKVNRTGWPKKKRAMATRQANMIMTNLCGLVNVDVSNKIENKSNNEVNIPTQSPITPPETDVEEKNEQDPILITAIRDENTNLTFASERAENSDMFTVSSDSLDTVLDVGSQLKTEIQKEIIANRKCKVNLSNKLPEDIKIRKSSRICFRRNKQLFLHRRIAEIKRERSDTLEEDSELTSNISSSGHSITPTDNNTKPTSPVKLCPTSVCPLSPRRLRKPRGRWYRER